MSDEMHQEFDVDRTEREPREGQWFSVTGNHGAFYQVLVQNGRRVEYEFANVDGSIDTCTVNAAGVHSGRWRHWYRGQLESVASVVDGVSDGLLARWNADGSIQQLALNGDGGIAVNIAPDAGTVAVGGYRDSEQSGLWVHMEKTGNMAVTSFDKGMLAKPALGFDAHGFVQWISDERGEQVDPRPDVLLGDFRALMSRVSNAGSDGWRLVSVEGTNFGKPNRLTCSAAGLPVQLTTAGFEGDIAWSGEPLAITSVRLTPQDRPAQFVELAIASIATGEVNVPSQHDATHRSVLAARVR